MASWRTGSWPAGVEVTMSEGDDTGRVLVGCSGWQYRDWRGSFYPGDLAMTKWFG